MDWKNKKVVVMGAGKSGIAAAGLLYKNGACPIIFDEKKDLDIAAVLEKLGDTRAQIITGSLPEDVRKEAAALVMSPGIPVDTPFVEAFRAEKIPVIGEIELAYVCAGGDVIAITGTNGKTTTTALTGRIMEDHFGRAFVVGNIGNPYTQAASEIREGDVTVAEVSSFQLETIETFHPKVSAILNITPDHLDRHHTMENYILCKEAVAKNQTKEDVCVLNYEDEHTRDFGNRCSARVVYFSSRRKLEEGIYCLQDEICLREGGAEKHLMNIHEMKLLGIHNVENVMAAIAMAHGYGVPMESIVRTVKDFPAVEHRIEYVRTVRGVDYYNDSKGTNPDAAIKAVQAMNRKTVLIGGGYDKGSSYDEWIESFGDKVTWLVLVGQTREKIAQCAREHGFGNVLLADTFEEAVKLCSEKALPGEAVLLSPACASWGMFPNYEARGRLFKDLVNAMEE